MHPNMDKTPRNSQPTTNPLSNQNKKTLHQQQTTNHNQRLITDSPKNKVWHAQPRLGACHLLHQLGSRTVDGTVRGVYIFECKQKALQDYRFL